MRGTPYTYYGDELGMTNIDMPTIAEYDDIEALGKYKTALAANEDMVEFMKVLNYSSRENGRTPMQWNESENAGFTTGVPWKKVNENFKYINVTVQNKDPNSILNHFRKMANVRRNNPVLIYGQYEVLQKEHPKIYAFTRELANVKMLVLLNFSPEKATINLHEIAYIQDTIINNYDTFIREVTTANLLPYQAVIFKIK